MFMDRQTVNFVTPAGVAAGSDSVKQDVDLFTARLNYKFGGPSDRKVLIPSVSRRIEKPRPWPGFFVLSGGVG